MMNSGRLQKLIRAGGGFHGNQIGEKAKVTGRAPKAQGATKVTQKGAIIVPEMAEEDNTSMTHSVNVEVLVFSDT
ncbi:MAG: hypothetical protein ACXU99_08355 [Thermodesulfobacteriota bacterium]